MSPPQQLTNIKRYKDLYYIINKLALFQIFTKNIILSKKYILLIFVEKYLRKSIDVKKNIKRENIYITKNK